MSRRTQVAHQRKALEAARTVGTPQTGQITVEQLVPMMMANGAEVSYRLGHNDEHRAVVLDAVCGPIRVPLVLDATNARLLAERLITTAEKVEALPPHEEVATPPAPEPVLTPKVSSRIILPS